MKVVAFNGSPRRTGNTALMIQEVFKVLEKEGVETEMIQVGGKEIRGCLACGKCRENKNNRCVVETDIVNDCIEKMTEADAIIMGSSVYFATLTSELKALIDRSGYVARGNGFTLSRKIGAAVVAGRRAGHIHTLDSINHFFFINQMILPGSSYWNLAMGGPAGAVEEDEEGMGTMRTLAENMAWLLKKTKA